MTTLLLLLLDRHLSQRMQPVPKVTLDKTMPLPAPPPSMPACDPRKEKWAPCAASTVKCKPPAQLNFYSQIFGEQDK